MADVLLTMQPPLADRLPWHARALVVATAATPTNLLLADAFTRLGYDGEVVDPQAALAAGPADVVLGRLDVLRTLDGVEPGLPELAAAGRAGALLLNASPALQAAHDKLATAHHLARAGVLHPASVLALEPAVPDSFGPPYVVKPRFGSWGRDVFRCETDAELLLLLASLAERPWFRAHGAVVQELVGGGGRDLRIVVAGGVVVGAIERIAQPGEWRTNVALGAVRRPATAPADARQLAVRATAALGLDLAGVDLIPDGRDGYLVLEVNGAVDFTAEYGAEDRDVFADAVGALVPAASAAAAAG